jgi:hypothetical protein
MRRSAFASAFADSGLPGLPPGKTNSPLSPAMSLTIERARRQRNAVFLASLHARGRHGPHRAVKVEFYPSGPDHLARARGGEYSEFESARRYALALAQGGHECRHIGIGHRRMMASRQALPLRQEVVEMAAPARRILAAAQPLRLGRIKHALDPAAKAGSGFRLLVPKRLEH